MNTKVIQLNPAGETKDSLKSAAMIAGDGKCKVSTWPLLPVGWVGNGATALSTLAPRACPITRTDEPNNGSPGTWCNLLAALMLLLLLVPGCTTAPKPNAAQNWGFWSHVPGTASFSARVAEQVKKPRVEEALKENVTAILEILQAETNRTPAAGAALVLARQTQRLVGLPDRPVDVRPMLSTNANVRAKSFAKLEKQFQSQNDDLAYIRRATEAAAAQGKAAAKQDSSLHATWWKMTTRIKNFINAHWLALMLTIVLVAYIAAKVLPIFFPYLTPALGALAQVAGRLIDTLKRRLRKNPTM